MHIKVMYQDGKVGEIEAYLLDELIRSNKIKKFRRSGKWVTIGVDPIREDRGEFRVVPERKETRKKRKNKV